MCVYLEQWTLLKTIHTKVTEAEAVYGLDTHTHTADTYIQKGQVAIEIKRSLTQLMAFALACIFIYLS